MPRYQATSTSIFYKSMSEKNIMISPIWSAGIIFTANNISHSYSRTDMPSLQKIIDNLKPKSSAGLDHISSKLLRHVTGIVAYPLSIVNQ